MLQNYFQKLYELIVLVTPAEAKHEVSEGIPK